jgi:epoxyqueuosine reductase
MAPQGDGRVLLAQASLAPAARVPRPVLAGSRLKDAVVARATSLGFDLVRVTSPDAIPLATARLAEWLASGHHGTMVWMAETQDRRADPRALWGDVRSVVMVGMSYAPPYDPLGQLAHKHAGLVSAYAARRDYHDVIKGRLKDVATYLGAKGGADVKVFVDTAPVMEKPLAEAAGLGWIGKHSVLVSREHGSWLFLGAIYTTALLPIDEPEAMRCGSCRRCLDVCPTDAFPAPHQLDARRCIAYLTIEHAGPIAREFRPAIGNRVFGCDDCLAVCPWNKFAETARDTKLALAPELALAPLASLARLDDAGFRTRFAGTPVKRTGRTRFMRNVLIAIGNSGDASLVPEAERLLDDPAPLVRGMAVWALSRLVAPARFRALAAARGSAETDAEVLAEWRDAALPTDVAA